MVVALFVWTVSIWLWSWLMSTTFYVWSVSCWSFAIWLNRAYRRPQLAALHYSAQYVRLYCRRSPAKWNSTTMRCRACPISLVWLFAWHSFCLPFLCSALSARCSRFYECWHRNHMRRWDSSPSPVARCRRWPQCSGFLSVSSVAWRDHLRHWTCRTHSDPDSADWWDWRREAVPMAAAHNCRLHLWIVALFAHSAPLTRKSPLCKRHKIRRKRRRK